MNKQRYYHQEENIKYIQQKLGREMWIQVSGHRKINGSEAGFWSALIPSNKIDQVFSDVGWDSSIGTQSPGFEQSSDGVIYLNKSNNFDRCENIVNYREFYGIKPDYVEVSEEFRLLNNLYYDKNDNKYYAIFDNGEVDEVVKYESPTIVYIKLQYLLRYATAKQMALLLFFDIRTEIKGSLKDNELEPFSTTVKEGNYFYNISGDEYSFGRKCTFSRLLGKKVIYPKPIEDCGYWPYERKKQYVDYSIGINEDGSPKTFTSNPDALANNFGANPDAPHYFTPVFFKKEVLQKYFSHPELYTIADGYLQCQSLWMLYIDNHHKDCISVYLGDLGRDLPEQEQLHWKSYNIISEEKLSSVKFQRDFLSLFTEPEISDLKFKLHFERFQKKWFENYQWELFKSLSENDEYNFSLLRIPITDNQEEFDHQVLSLVKTIIDSINEKEIVKLLLDGSNLKGGISKLERWFTELKIPDFELQIKFLRNLQELRSAGTGHRKGKNYEKISKAFGINGKNFSDIFDMILNKADDFILFLDKNFLEKN